ncbi:MAG: signal peptidase II [Desulfobacterales bacterium]
MTFHTTYKPLIVIAALVVFFDQVTKIMVLNVVALNRTIEIIPGFLNITHIQNPGVAFGIFSQQPSSLKQFLLMGASLLAVCLIFYFYHKSIKASVMMMSAFALILGGAVGNLVDRIRFGRVIDFIDVHVGGVHWPSFNIADSAISVGVAVILFLVVFRQPDLMEREERHESPED